MFKFIIPACLILSCCGCSWFGKDRDPEEVYPSQKLRSLHDRLVEEARGKKDPTSGWLLAMDCDGMLVNAPMLCSSKVDFLTMEAAEYPEDQGKFTRRPISSGLCYPHPEDPEGGSKTTWSRDMSEGMAIGSWCRKNIALVERHINYGENHSTAGVWKMGDPLADGRVLYTPAMKGLWYQLRFAMGGDDSISRQISNVYTSGLDGYQAHLQILDIWLRADINESLNESDAVPRKPDGEVEMTDMGEMVFPLTGKPHLLDVSETMYQRLQEHSDREPDCPLYQAVFHRYSDGQFDRVIDLLANEITGCSYVRCGESTDCHLAERIFVSAIILRWMDGPKLNN